MVTRRNFHWSDRRDTNWKRAGPIKPCVVRAASLQNPSPNEYFEGIKKHLRKQRKQINK